jgi:hypothetical protein
MSRNARTRARSWLKGAGFILGLAGVALALLAWRIPGGDGTLGADVIFVSRLSGEVDVSPIGPFMTRAGLEAPGDVRGTLKVRNQTGSRLVVRPSAVGDNRDLDGLLRVDIRQGANLLFSGPLGRLRKDIARPFVLAPGQRAPLTFRAWLPIEIRSGYQGRIVQVDVTLSVRPLAS